MEACQESTALEHLTFLGDQEKSTRRLVQVAVTYISSFLETWALIGI